MSDPFEKLIAGYFLIGFLVLMASAYDDDIELCFGRALMWPILLIIMLIRGSIAAVGKMFE